MTAVTTEMLVSNDVLVKFIYVALESCSAIQERLNTEIKSGCVKELLSVMEQTLVIIGGVILHLIKRSDNVSDRRIKEGTRCIGKHRLAKVLLDEVMLRCPMVVVPRFGYSTPLVNVLFKVQYKPLLYSELTKCCSNYNYTLMKMIVDSQVDLNATDHEGNTILHIVMSDIQREIDFQKKHKNLAEDIIEQYIDTAIDIAKLLLDHGSYPHAKNKQGRYPGDQLHDSTVLLFYKIDELKVRFRDLMKNYDCTLTLKYMAAIKIIEYRIPYRHHLPKYLVKFVDLN